MALGHRTRVADNSTVVLYYHGHHASLVLDPVAREALLCIIMSRDSMPLPGVIVSYITQLSSPTDTC